jgi:hypothetical protein
LPPLSASQIYSARPDAPVRYVPADPFAVPTTTAVAAGAELVLVEDDETAAAGELATELEPLLPHAVTTNATPTNAATPPTRNLVALKDLVIPSSFAVRCTRKVGRLVNKDT